MFCVPFGSRNFSNYANWNFNTSNGRIQICHETHGYTLHREKHSRIRLQQIPARLQVTYTRRVTRRPYNSYVYASVSVSQNGRRRRNAYVLRYLCMHCKFNLPLLASCWTLHGIVNTYLHFHEKRRRSKQKVQQNEFKLHFKAVISAHRRFHYTTHSLAKDHTTSFTIVGFCMFFRVRLCFCYYCNSCVDRKCCINEAK